MADPIIAICIEGGLVQCVSTNDPELKAKVVIVDRDCDGFASADPTYVRYFFGGDAYIRSETLAVDADYCTKAAAIAEERGT